MASFSVPCPKVSPLLAASSHSSQERHCVAALLRSGSRSNSASLIAQFQGCNRSQSNVFKVCAQLNEVSVDKVSQSCLKPDTTMSKKSEDDYKVPDASSISTFMAQVMGLVKLVDSKDIVELELKQMDCEVLIRKKEALAQASIAAPMFMPPPTYQAMPSPPLPSSNSLSPAPVASAPAKPPAPVKPSSSHPPFKCPMAGNFYRSSSPGSPPFVKVGDKVQKGQVLCIIEAMKLMNEIEADQSGTVVEILVDDGKPVSVDLPLFIIEP